MIGKFIQSSLKHYTEFDEYLISAILIFQFDKMNMHSCELHVSQILAPFFLSQQQFSKRFVKISRFEDPYTRVYDICLDSQYKNKRVAIKDYSAASKQQRDDVLTNLESYRGLEQIQSISQLIAFCQIQLTGDILTAFQYDDSNLAQLISQQSFKDNRNQFYRFVLRQLIFVIQSSKSTGIDIEELILQNILIFKKESQYKMKILYDQREKRYEKVAEGIKVFDSLQKIQNCLNIMNWYQQNQGEQMVYQLGLLLLDIIYEYEINCKRKINIITNNFIDVNEGYLLFEDICTVKLNSVLINQKKRFILSIGDPALFELVKLIEKMIVHSAQRINLDQILVELKSISVKPIKTVANQAHQPKTYTTPSKEISPIKSKQSSIKQQDSLKYSDRSNQYVHKNKIIATRSTIDTKNIISEYAIESKSNFRNIFVNSIPIPRQKLLQLKAHQQIIQKLNNFIIDLESKTIVKKDYFDNSYYYGEINTSTQKRLGLGIYFYNNDDIYFGSWKENSLVNGTYIFKNGQSYEGIVKKGKQGWGKYYYLNGNIYEGDWKDDLKEGRGKMNYPNGDIYQGIWVKGKKNGHGIYIYNDGTIYEGNFVNGKKNGAGTITFSNKTRVQAFWQSNHIQGRGKILYFNGNYYEGQFYLSQKDGCGTYKWSDDYRYQGQFKNDDMNGQGKVKYPQNQYYEGKIMRGKRQGHGLYKYANGDQFRGQWKNDEKIIGQYRFNDGRSFDGKFNKNEIHYGVMVYPNNQSYQGQFMNGQRNGKGQYRSSKGQILYEGKWLKDKFVSKV